MGKKSTTRKVYRDAGTGRFVSEKEAEKNPKTTVSDTVPTGKKKK